MVCKAISRRVAGCVLPLLLAVSSVSEADWVAETPRPDSYIGFNVGSSELVGTTLGTVAMSNLNLRLGYHFADYFAVEGHVGWGSDNTGVLLKSPNSRYAALFLRLDLPYDRVNLYLLAGGSYFESDVVTTTAVKKGNETSPAYGVGIELFGNRDTALTLEIARYLENSVHDRYDSVGVGFVTHFDWPPLR
ncbi:MAG: porin family protein [Gammaproteobacteria bacterium]|nr:porin family protein [Gammaproteobacteria bacterium]